MNLAHPESYCLYMNAKGQLVKRQPKGGIQLLQTKEIAEGLQQFFDWAQDQVTYLPSIVNLGTIHQVHNNFWGILR